ncbi:DUF5686 family protein [Sphingobacterium sp. HJSM2_6]|uniref:DUF5686 family protein n=1 Tax=Sphingobacterium sp. HJSM2_6 TaxID=3366264 RepID=UPI003BD08C62
MRGVRFYGFLILLFSVLSLSENAIYAQSLIKGLVVDKETDLPLAGASISYTNSNIGTSTDSLGKFQLSAKLSNKALIIQALGYKTQIIQIPSDLKDWVIALESTSSVIEAISITHRGKYTNKNNKAVELIDLVIDHKYKNRLTGKDSLQFNQYDKLKFGFLNPKATFERGLLDLNFLFENIDSNSIADKKLLTVFLEESNAHVYGKQNPSKFKKQIYSQKKTEFNKRYINNPNIQEFMNYMFQPVDVYDESVFVINKQFLSPIADNAKLYYRYYLTDTVFNKEGYFIQLAFEPRNDIDLLFKGTLTIAMDGSYAVKSAEMAISENSNLNFLKEGTISFHYSKQEQGIMLLDSTQFFASFGIRKGESFFANRTSINTNYRLNQPFPEQIFRGAPVEVLANAEQGTLERPINLNSAEAKTYENIERLNNKKSFNALLATGYLLAQGYYVLGKLELGPLEYLYSRNNIEGNRFRIGGRTTQELTDKAYLEGYLAYGLRDERLKYYLKGAVSLNGNSVVKFPAHYIEAAIQHDILEPGMGLSYLKGDSFFRSIRRNSPTKWFDTKAYQLQHVIEFGNHISVSTSLTHMNRNTVGDLRLVSSADPDQLLRQIYSNEAQVDLRWAPNEKFFYRNLTRRSIVERYPVFNVSYTRSLAGLWNTSYPYEKFRASASKRLFLNQLGFADVQLTAGKIWGTLPYPLLELPNVRQKEDRHKVDYDLMNPMEFAADEYLKLGFYHQLQGFLLNKIPLIKNLKLREVWGAQMFYGKLSDHNNPYLSQDVVHFDKNNDGEIITQVLNNTPYWEGSVGLDNILRVLRVEYVKRLSYANYPNSTKDRIRVSVNINF